MTKREDMKAVCFVTAIDHARYWSGEELVTVPIPNLMKWSTDAIDRRAGLADRRSARERRWERTKGRRYRLIGRRTGDVR